MGMLITLLSISLCLFLLLVLVKFLHRVWWTPIRIQYMMGRQGIKGPSYRFIQGNNTEILDMRKESMSRPMEISHHIFPRAHPHIHSWVKIYGKNFLNWYGHQAQLVVTEPELIKEILNNRDGAYSKAEVAVYIKKIFGNGLSRSEGEKWAKNRKLANEAFHGQSLKSMIPVMIAGVEVMLERWKHYEGKELEVYEEFKVMTSDVISRTAFGRSYLEGQDIFKMLHESLRIATQIDFKTRFPGISKFLKSEDDVELDKLQKRIRESMIEMVKKREEKLITGEVDSFGNDFLGLLIKANHDANEKMRISLDDMVDECKTFYSGGQSTTTDLLVWTIFLLAAHQNWQDEARKEVLQLFGQQIPNSDGIARLKTMNMIIYESLRLYPPVDGLTRQTKKEVRLGKLILSTNLNLFIPTLALHHDPNIWGEDVHLFKPERFLEGVAKATNNNMAAFLAFSLGPRNCVGSDFATTEAKIALSMILKRYTFTLSPAYVHSPIYQLLTIRPQHGVQIILHAV